MRARTRPDVPARAPHDPSETTIMSARRWGLAGSLAGLACVIVYSTLGASAAQQETEKPQPGKEVTLAGRIVDMNCYMTGSMPSSDPVKCTRDCIEAGVPAALETRDGLIVLGEGTRSAAKTLAPLAHKEVQVKGRLFEKAGARYLDIVKVTAEPEKAEPPRPAKPNN